MNKTFNNVSIFIYFHLYALKEKILSFKFVEPVGVDDENTIIENETEASPNNQKSSSKMVWPRASKQGVHYRWKWLKQIQDLHNIIDFKFPNYL